MCIRDRAGLVDGFRGASGGYRLARPAVEIGLIEIVEAIEGPLAITECSIHGGHCGIEDQCGVRANWRYINDVVIQALRSVSLAQMLVPMAPTLPTPLHQHTKRIDLRLANA